MAVGRLRLDEAVLLVIDMQEKLLGHIADHAAVTGRCELLIRGCAALGLPILVTEQYPKGLGPTVASVRQVLPADQVIHNKLKFSAYIEPIRRELAEMGRRTVILCGIESHVCVLQTAMDLVDCGFVTVLASDATGSRHHEDKVLSINRMRDFGVIGASVEMILLELVHEAGTQRFKKIAPMIR